MTETLLFFLAFFSEVAGTLIGFGSSTIFLPLALFFVDFKVALVLAAFLHIFGNIGRIAFFRYGINMKLILFFGVPGVALTIVGAALVNYISHEILKITLGAFLVTFSAVSILKPDFKFAASNSNAMIGGGLSGFIAGLIGTGGALRGAFLNAFGLRKEVYIATAAAIALPVDVIRIPMYFASGFMEYAYLSYLPILFIIAIAGSYVGQKIVGRISQRIFTNVVLIALLLIGVMFLLGI